MMKSNVRLTDLLAEYFDDVRRAGVTDFPVAACETVGPTEKSSANPHAVPFPIKNNAPDPLESITAQIRPGLSAQAKERLLGDLAQVVAGCPLCPKLVSSRTQTVFGAGNPDAELVFVGEGPGLEEDQQGIPFVGRSGQLLTDIIVKGMKMRREETYICNIVRCRPPENRNPLPDEVLHCRPFLEMTLRIIDPKYICCLGAVAAQNLLQTEKAIGKLRGIIHRYQGAKVVCTYHPAYLLRNPAAKVPTWEDIKILLREMGRM
ncbi:MAG: uracil-DNA glycosylase [Thermoguttaceae bacterium]|jgi:uracil-DNA glycosylase family 4